MLSLNRGEWSELYCVLFLLVKPNLSVVDENLNEITSDLYEIKKIIAETNFPLEYEIVDNKILLYAVKDKMNEFSKDEVDRCRKELYERIINAGASNGSFSIESIDNFLESFSLGQVIKAKSGLKEDINVVSLDKRQKNLKELKYSIKSSLGSPATLLNSSGHTNFKYKIYGMNDELMRKINSIETRTKLVDRLKAVDQKCKVEFDSVQSEAFLYNLKMVDSSMDKYIANTLLYSYRHENKKLKEIFKNANNFNDETYAEKKLGDFLLAVSFGFFPGKKWSGENSVNGGLFLVKENGQIVVLDLIYFSNSVRRYLINNTQLDSPSSTRYHMLEVYKENNEYYFNLNLQIRYIRR